MASKKIEGFQDYQYGNYGKTNDWYNSKFYNIKSVIQFQNDIQNNPDRNDTQNIDPVSFNYDSLYNTNDLTQKYSFIKSSFLYRPISTNDNDYLSQVYYNNNPLEVEQMCVNLNNTTCGLTSACVYVGNNKCVPGNINGPYTSYSDIDMDFYYYKGKCYGNCPGQFYPTPTNITSIPTSTTIPTPTNITSIPTSTTIPTPTNFTSIPTSTTIPTTLFTPYQTSTSVPTVTIPYPSVTPK